MGKLDPSIIHSFANQDYSYEKRHILTSSRTNQEAIPQILYYWAIKKCGFCSFMFLPNFLHILLAQKPKGLTFYICYEAISVTLGSVIAGCNSTICTIQFSFTKLLAKELDKIVLHSRAALLPVQNTLLCRLVGWQVCPSVVFLNL